MGASAKVMSRTSRSLQLGEDEHLGAEVFGEPPLVGLVVAQHELAGAALKGAGAGDLEALCAGGDDDRACCCGHGVAVG